jgi:hypothetical protein
MVEMAEQLGSTRHQPAGLEVDDVELLLDAEGERLGPHENLYSHWVNHSIDSTAAWIRFSRRLRV